MTAARYAVYWAPEPEHPLWQAGCEWLARDPASPALQWPARDATAEPRRYGFHATLKAPMKLREERDATSLVDAVGALAARTRRFMLPALYIAWMQQFLALQPRHHVLPTHPLRQLADACVREFDPWRAPLADDELQRRLADPHLDDAQREAIKHWGHARVFDHWRFHMTLTDSLHYTDPRRDTLLQDAQRHFAAALAEPLGCASLCIFAEPAPGAPFVLTHRFKLAP
jgi:hypothetical protein